MNATVVGTQLGDEGKGSVVDLFGAGADVVVRYQGGDNAGHTVTHEGEEYALRLLPSGVVRGTVGVLGNGCVVNPATLFEEVDRLRDRGLDPAVYVAERAHVVLPYHRVLDDAEEADRAESDASVGTTGNGIGPAYEDKAGRRGVRVGDLLRPETLRERLAAVVPRKRAVATETLGVDAGDAFDVDSLVETCRGFGERFAAEGMVVDAGTYLRERTAAGASVLFESAQGTFLDVDHGDYPFVTSSNPTAAGAAVGTGVPAATVGDGHVIGVAKAYLSRVGRGPMPTEFGEADAAAFREAVGGFGTVTGRPRRIGWLDLPMLRHAAAVNGLTGLVVNHVDALAGLDELRVCTAYDLDGERLERPPSTAADWARCRPRYEPVATWDDRDWRAVADAGYDALPAAARDYVEFVSDALSVPVFAVGVGPDRAETVVRRHPFESTDRTATTTRT